MTAMHNDFSGTLEIEVLEESVEAADQWQKCTKNLGHEDFVPVSKFSVQHLPEEYRKSEYEEAIKLMSTLTVKVKVEYTSEKRPSDDLFHQSKGQYVTRTGSGFLASTTAINIQRCFDTTGIYQGNRIKDIGQSGYPWDCNKNFNIEKCIAFLKNLLHPLPPQLQTCFEDPNFTEDFTQLVQDVLANDALQEIWRELQKNGKYGDLEEVREIFRIAVINILTDTNNAGDTDPANVMDDSSTFTNSSTPEPGQLFLIYTANHVVFDEKEAEHTIIEFFYDDESKTGVEEVKGVTMTLLDKTSDVCKLLCNIKNSELVQKLLDLEDKFVNAFSALPSEKNPPLAVICSHPHGNFKHITVGEWTTRWWHPCIPGLHRTNFEYKTPTCPGSSGGPVLILGNKENTLCVPHLFHLHHGTTRDESNNQSSVCERWSWKYKRLSEKNNADTFNVEECLRRSLNPTLINRIFNVKL